MPKYRAAMTVFGLSTGDVFESDDPRWEIRAEGGLLVKVDGDTPATVTDEGNLRIPEGHTLLTKEEYDERVAAGDPEPVKRGEVYAQQVPAEQEKSKKSQKVPQQGSSGG